MTQLILFNLFNGLIVGAFYALMALGLSLILNLSGVINFAHGGFLALGAYFAYSLIPYIGFWGALVVAPLLTALVGLIVERVLIRRLYGRDPLYSLLLTFGLAYILEDGTRFIWGPQSLPFSVPTGSIAPLSSQFFFLDRLSLFMVLLVGVGGGRLFLILNRTRLGMRIRAGTLDLDTVSVLGVNVRLLRSLNFGLGHLSRGPRRRARRRACSACSPPSAARSSCRASSPSSSAGSAACPEPCLGGLLIGVASGVVTVFSPPPGGGDLRHDGGSSCWSGRAACWARKDGSQ